MNHSQQHGETPTDFARVQVNSFGATFSDAIDVAAQVRAAFQDATYPGIFNGALCQAVEIDSEVHLTDDEAGFAGIYQVSQDFIINYIYVAPITVNFMLLEDSSYIFHFTTPR